MTAPDQLSTAVRQLFTKGDLQGMRSHLLHSSAWIQHGQTRFGNEQITSSWMVWLANIGLGECVEAVSLGSGSESLDLLTLKTKSSQHTVRIALWNWHNGEFIKRMVCIPDTGLVANSLGSSTCEVARLLPRPDPLHISDYDQQQHPFSVNVTPADLADLPAGMQSALQGWWSMWQDEQLAAASENYAQDARIQLPGKEKDQSVDQLLKHLSGTFLLMQRRYCVPESVLLDASKPNQVAILWHMEGDMKSDSGKSESPRQRVRNSLITYLEIDQGLIVRDTTVSDSAALARRLSG